MKEARAMTASEPATAWPHPAQVFHVGIVADDIDAAMREMSADLGISWKGGELTERALVIDGEDRRIGMRIAHSVQGPPHLELIQAAPGTPWQTPSGAGVHHVCYWSDQSAEICAYLEAAGNRRVLGAPGSASGYFLSPSGMYVEIIHRDLRNSLADWLAMPQGAAAERAVEQ